MKNKIIEVELEDLLDNKIYHKMTYWEKAKVNLLREEIVYLEINDNEYKNH